MFICEALTAGKDAFGGSSRAARRKIKMMKHGDEAWTCYDESETMWFGINTIRGLDFSKKYKLSICYTIYLDILLGSLVGK